MAEGDLDGEDLKRMYQTSAIWRPPDLVETEERFAEARRTVEKAMSFFSKVQKEIITEKFFA